MPIQSYTLCLLVLTTGVTSVAQTQPSLTASELIARNASARGGLNAWRNVRALTLTGKLGAGGNQRTTLRVPGQAGVNKVVPSRPKEEVMLPFVMELERPRKMRFELQFNGQTAVQVYDGKNGWKLRPFLNRRDVEPYTEEELKMSAVQADLDGPLIDAASKGTQIALDGMEKVGERDNYRLKLILKDGQTLHVWLDAQSFLETKIEGQPRRLDGVYHPVETYFQDYRDVDGLKIPFLLETRLLPVQKTATGQRDTPVPPERTVIDKVVVNPKLDESLFSKPQLMASSAAAPSPRK